MQSLHLTAPGILMVSEVPSKHQLQKQRCVCTGHATRADEASAHVQLHQL